MNKKIKRIIVSVMACAMAAFTVLGSSCGVSDWVSEKYDQLKCDHENERLLPAVESTCSEKGLTSGVECLDCGKILVKQEEIPLKEHTLTHYDEIAATCLTKGYTEGDYCVTCGTWIKERKEINRLGHKFVKTKGNAATCMEEGLTDGEACKHCGEVIVAQEVIPMKSHNYVNGVCLMCGDYSYPAAEGKEYDLALVQVDDTIANKWIRFQTGSATHAYMKINCTSTSGATEMLIGSFGGGSVAGCANTSASKQVVLPESMKYIKGSGYIDILFSVGEYTVEIMESGKEDTKETYTFRITSESKALGFMQQGQTENAWAYFVTEK